MKKTLLTVGALFIVFASYSQIKVGIKAGANFANVSVEDAINDPESKTGYHFGAFAEVGLGGIALQPEILFSTKGAEFDGLGSVNLSYLEIPILFKKDFAKILNIHLGPQFGILSSAESEIEDPITGQTFEDDIKDELKSADISAVVGAGLNLPMGLGLGARYVYGLSDINDGFGTEISNRTFQVYLEYKFN